MGDLEDFKETVLPQLVEAETALHRGDIEPRLAMWSRRDPLTLMGAAGMVKSGWDEISEVFRWLANRFSDMSEYRFDLVAAEAVGDMAYTVGYERYTASIDGRPVERHALRVTHIFRREDGEWKIVHRHGDNVSPDQDPPAEEATD